jgi:hypothetical protein
MGKTIIVSFLVVIMLTVSACSFHKIEEVRIYKMESYSETNQKSLKVISEMEDVNILKSAISNAYKNFGVKNMADPEYKIELGKEEYFLWADANSGTLMNLKDNNTTYSFPESSNKKVNELVKKYTINETMKVGR